MDISGLSNNLQCASNMWTSTETKLGFDDREIRDFGEEWKRIRVLVELGKLRIKKMIKINLDLTPR